MTITLTERPGVCAWCGCTEERGCGAGCSWANRACTLCSACVDLVKALRTQKGRRWLQEAASTHASEALLR
jgi:hypothetical protein